MNRRIHCLALAALLVTPLPATAGDWWRESLEPTTALDQRVVSRDSHDAYRINWIHEYVEVMAGATVDNVRAVNAAHAVAMAKKTARHLAYEKLAETIAGIQVTSESRFDRELMLDSDLKTSVRAFLRGAVVVKEQVSNYPDGSVWAEVVLGVHLVGDRGVGGQVTRFVVETDSASADAIPTPADPVGESVEDPEEPAAAATSAPAAAPAATTVPRYRESFTGLVVDARGLGVRPALMPRLVTPAGKVVYGSGVVDSEQLLRRGLVAYAPDLEQARKLDRVGDKPLVVRAIGVEGSAKADLVVSEDAVSLIHATLREKNILRKCAVAIVID